MEPFERIAKDPRLRWQDVPEGAAIIAGLRLDPSDKYLKDLFEIKIAEQQQKAEALVSIDPCYGNAPARGSLPPIRGRIPIATLLTGDTFSIGITQCLMNVLLTGATGAAKTSLLRMIVRSLLENGVSSLVVDNKGDFLDSSLFAEERLPVLHLSVKDLRLAALERPVGVELQHWVNSIVEVTASMHLSLYASQRLLIERLQLLFQRRSAPSLSDWVKLIESIKPAPYSREAGYKEAALYALKSILWATGSALDYSSSEMMQSLLDFRGCVVLRCDGVNSETASLIASLFINYEFCRRSLPDARLSPRVFVLDDALGMVLQRGEDRINPIGQWSFLGRSRGMGFIVASHNWNLIAPALRNNAGTVIACGSRGEDAFALGRHLSLNKEQVTRLSTLQPGEVVAFCPGVHPLPVLGFVPKVD